MDMPFNDTVAKLTAANRSVVASAMQFSKIAVRAQSLLARQQMEAMENCLEAGTRQMKLVSETRDPRDLVARQAEVAVELGEKLVAVAQEAMDIQSQARDEIATWVEDGLKTVKAETTAVAPKARPAARPRVAKKAAAA